MGWPRGGGSGSRSVLGSLHVFTYFPCSSHSTRIHHDYGSVLRNKASNIAFYGSKPNWVNWAGIINIRIISGVFTD